MVSTERRIAAGTSMRRISEFADNGGICIARSIVTALWLTSRGVLYRGRSADLRDESQPRAQRRLGAAEWLVARHLDLPDRTAARNAACGRAAPGTPDCRRIGSCITIVDLRGLGGRSRRPRRQ